MKEKINLHEELNRMKNLFGYEKGVVISEQIPYANAADVKPFQNPAAQFALPGSKKEEYPQCIQVFGNPRASQSGKQFSINGTGDWKDYFFFPNGFYGNHKITGTKPPHGKYVCDGTTIKILPLEGEKTTQPPKTQLKTQPKTKENLTIPQELKDTNGVKAFQDWLDTKEPGWLKKYGTINKDLKKGYGKFGPSTSAAWEKYKGTYATKKIEYKRPGLEVSDIPTDDQQVTSYAAKSPNTGGLGVPTEDGEFYADNVEE